VIAKATKKPAPLPPQPKTKQIVPVQRVAPVVPRPAPVRVDMRGYGRGVFRAIQQQKRYPLMAYRMRFEGVVIVAIKIKRNGRLLGHPRIVRSSGHNILDREAIRMVKASPIPPFTNGYHKPYVLFHLPVRFHIKQ
jgi:TonB family protein